MRIPRAAVILALAVVFAGCRDNDLSTEARTPSASGTWTGVMTIGTMTLTLAEDAGGSITGAGNIQGSGEGVSLTVTGTHVHPSITLTLRSSGFQDANYTGKFVTENTISGSLTGSGFNNETLTLTRQ